MSNFKRFTGLTLHRSESLPNPSAFVITTECLILSISVRSIPHEKVNIQGTVTLTQTEQSVVSPEDVEKR